MTMAMTVVDRFSKVVHYVALAKLPTAKEAAEVLVNQVFRMHGLPHDVVSDCGPCGLGQWTNQTHESPLSPRTPSGWNMPMILSLSAATGLSPFQIFYGYQPLLFSSQAKEAQVLSAHGLVRGFCHLA